MRGVRTPFRPWRAPKAASASARPVLPHYFSVERHAAAFVLCKISLTSGDFHSKKKTP